MDIANELVIFCKFLFKVVIPKKKTILKKCYIIFISCNINSK